MVVYPGEPKGPSTLLEIVHGGWHSPAKLRHALAIGHETSNRQFDNRPATGLDQTAASRPASSTIPRGVGRMAMPALIFQ